MDGDLVATGGMDIANLRLAEYISEDYPLHIVAHRAEATLTSRARVQLHRSARPYNMQLFGEPLLDWAGRKIAKRLALEGNVTAIVNGGNCLVNQSVNWVHYVHAAYEPVLNSSGLRRLKAKFHRWLSLRNERIALTQAKLVLCNSQLTANHVTSLLRIPAERVRVVYYGIDVDRFEPATETERTGLRQRLGWDAKRPYLLFIGALGDRRKGFDSVASAMEKLCSEPSWDANLVVVGSGADKGHWEKHFRDLGLEHRVSFLGFRSDVPDLLRAADALVAPTRYEAYGLGVHEAICCGLPAFVSRESGVAERYPDSLRPRLLLEDPDNVDDLVRKLRDWRAGMETYRTLVGDFSNELRKRTWRDMAKEFVALVQGAE